MEEDSNTLEIEKEDKTIDRSNLNLQTFFNDMKMLGQQLRNDKLSKPIFPYGDSEITNYLLWLILGELILLNDNIN